MHTVRMSSREQRLTTKKRAVRCPTKALYMFPLSRIDKSTAKSLLGNVVLYVWDGYSELEH